MDYETEMLNSLPSDTSPPSIKSPAYFLRRLSSGASSIISSGSSIFSYDRQLSISATNTRPRCHPYPVYEIDSVASCPTCLVLRERTGMGEAFSNTDYQSVTCTSRELEAADAEGGEGELRDGRSLETTMFAPKMRFWDRCRVWWKMRHGASAGIGGA